LLTREKQFMRGNRWYSANLWDETVLSAINSSQYFFVFFKVFACITKSAFNTKIQLFHVLGVDTVVEHRLGPHVLLSVLKTALKRANLCSTRILFIPLGKSKWSQSLKDKFWKHLLCWLKVLCGKNIEKSQQDALY